MKKTFVLVAILVFVFFCFFVSCNYWGIGEKVYTPKKYLNNAKASSVDYANDSLRLLGQLFGYLKECKYSFDNKKKYSNSIDLALDTILYNQDFSRLAVFVVVKNVVPDNEKNVVDGKIKYLFDAFCYLGIRPKGINDTIHLKWLKNFYPINWNDRKEISSIIRSMYFTEFSTIKDSSGAYLFKYNLDDRRFWTSSVWGKYFDGIQ